MNRGYADGKWYGGTRPMDDCLLKFPLKVLSAAPFAFLSADKPLFYFGMYLHPPLLYLSAPYLFFSFTSN